MRAILLALLLSGCAHGRLIEGGVRTGGDGDVLGVPEAQVLLRPLPTIDGGALPLGLEGALGVAISDAEGRFELRALPRAGDVLRLPRRQPYEITVRCPGFNIFQGRFDHERRRVSLTVVVEGKLQPDGSDEALHRRILIQTAGGPDEAASDRMHRGDWKTGPQPAPLRPFAPSPLARPFARGRYRFRRRSLLTIRCSSRRARSP